MAEIESREIASLAHASIIRHLTRYSLAARPLVALNLRAKDRTPCLSENRVVLRDMLEQVGFQIAEAAYGREALDLARSQRR